MPTLAREVRIGVLWATMGRVVVRGMSAVAFPILSFLLVPEDFGTFAIATSVLFFVEVLTRTSFDSALVQHDSPDAFYDLAWTMSVVLGVVQTLAVCVLAVPIAHFYETPMLAPVMFATSITFLLRGLRSVKVVELSRQLKVKQLTFYESSGVLLYHLVAIGFAALFKNVWAIVVGVVARDAYLLIASYRYAPYSPRFTFDREKLLHLWNFGKWITLAGILQAFVNHSDRLVLGKILGVAALGFYAMSYQLGRVIPTELVEGLRRVYFPALSRLKADLPALSRVYLKIYIVTSMAGGLVAVGLFLLAGSLVDLVLANKWLPIVDVVKVFAIWSYFQVNFTAFNPLLLAIAKPDLAMKLEAGRAIILFLLLYPLTKAFDAVGAAGTVLISTALISLSAIFLTKKFIICRKMDLAMPHIVTLVGGLAAYAALKVAVEPWQLTGWLLFFVSGLTVTLAFGSATLMLDKIFALQYVKALKSALGVRAPGTTSPATRLE